MTEEIRSKIIDEDGSIIFDLIGRINSATDSVREAMIESKEAAHQAQETMVENGEVTGI